MQVGVDLRGAAGWFGMTVEQLEAPHGYHYPDFREEAAEAFGEARQILLHSVRASVDTDD